MPTRRRFTPSGIHVVPGGGAWLALVSFDPQTPEAFFRSVREAFQANEEHAGSMGVGILLVALAAVLAGLALPDLKRRRTAHARRVSFARLALARGFTEEDVALVETLAAHAGTWPERVATHLDVFERATAAELRGHPPTREVREGDLAARIRHLRTRFGFATRSAHEPLLTTRELVPGSAVELLGQKTAVGTVTEAYFTVTLHSQEDATVGLKVPLSVQDEYEASHSIACPLLAVEAHEGRWTLRFAHDEAPARQQHRRYVRVPATGPLELLPAGQGARGRHTGELLDVSLHGAALVLHEKVAVRDRVRVGFSFRDQAFRQVEAVVLECEGPPKGPFRVRLEFRELSRGDDRRLAAAIAHATARPSGMPPSVRARA